MNRTLLFALALAPLSASASPEADLERGKALHDAHCFRCHDTSVYTREDRRIRDRAGLEKQVRRCELSLGLRWFDEDVKRVVDYLDRNFYRFGE